MSEMVERVAQAIYDVSEPSCSWEEALKTIYIDCAKAAIAAMREPTTNMQILSGVPVASAKAIWQDMIDAALKD